MSLVDHDAPQLVYKQIKADLLSRIHSGRVAARLPNELDLVREYGVARSSVRRAIAELVAEDVVTRTPGRGTFIVRRSRPALRVCHFVSHQPQPGDPQPDPTDYPIAQDIMAGVAEGARSRGVRFDILSADYYRPERTLNLLRSLGPGDGLIVGGHAPIVDAAVALGVPFVVCYLRVGSPVGFHVVTYDYRAAVRMGMRHLMECGVRDVALITPEDPNGGGMAKVQVARAAAQEFGAELPVERILRSSSEQGLASLEVERYLETHKLPEAFLCSTDNIAAGVVNALHQKGLAVPQDAMVMGYSDFPIARATTPPLSTVRVPRHEIGVRAVDVLARAIEAGPDCQPIFELIQADIVVRGSTIPKRKEVGGDVIQAS